MELLVPHPPTPQRQSCQYPQKYSLRSCTNHSPRQSKTSRIGLAHRFNLTNHQKGLFCAQRGAVLLAPVVTGNRNDALFGLREEAAVLGADTLNSIGVYSENKGILARQVVLAGFETATSEMLTRCSATELQDLCWSDFRSRTLLCHCGALLLGEFGLVDLVNYLSLRTALGRKRCIVRRESKNQCMRPLAACRRLLGVSDGIRTREPSLRMAKMLYPLSYRHCVFATPDC